MDTTPADAGSDNPPGAGPGAAGVTARLEVHEERRAARTFARVFDREYFGVRRAGRGCRPCPTTMPSGETITAPTIGFGVVTPSRALREITLAA